MEEAGFSREVGFTEYRVDDFYPVLVSLGGRRRGTTMASLNVAGSSLRYKNLLVVIKQTPFEEYSQVSTKILFLHGHCSVVTHKVVSKLKKVKLLTFQWWLKVDKMLQ